MSCSNCLRDFDTRRTHDGYLLCEDCWSEAPVCEECGSVVWNIEKYDLCSRCYEEIYTECKECGKEIKKEESENHNNDFYCDECFEEKFTKCYECGDYFERDDLTEAFRHSYCEDCFNDNFHRCSECEDIIWRDDTRFHNDDAYCSDCYDDNFFACVDCGRTFEHTDSITYNDELYCSRCVPRDRAIHVHGYKPRPEFLGRKGPHFGIELEVADYNDNVEENSEELLEKIGHFAYLKEDCSIENCGHCGFEIVTHPISWDWIHSHQKDMDHIFALAEKGFRSYETNTCGMHVHVSKRDISNLQVYKLVSFFKENSDFIFRMSTRERRAFNSWSGIDFYYKDIKIAKEKRDDSRGALNLSPRNTIEFRIFRGTLNKEAFYRNLEFVSAILEFSKQFGMKEMKAEKFFEFVRAKRGDFKRLYRFMIDRITKKKIFKTNEAYQELAKRELEKREKTNMSLSEMIKN